MAENKSSDIQLFILNLIITSLQISLSLPLKKNRMRKDQEQISRDGEKRNIKLTYKDTYFLFFNKTSTGMHRDENFSKI